MNRSIFIGSIPPPPVNNATFTTDDPVGVTDDLSVVLTPGGSGGLGDASLGHGPLGH